MSTLSYRHILVPLNYKRTWYGYTKKLPRNLTNIKWAYFANFALL